jgi:hypothetical protein
MVRDQIKLRANAISARTRVLLLTTRLAGRAVGENFTRGKAESGVVQLDHGVSQTLCRYSSINLPLIHLMTSGCKNCATPSLQLKSRICSGLFRSYAVGWLRHYFVLSRSKGTRSK